MAKSGGGPRGARTGKKSAPQRGASKGGAPVRKPAASKPQAQTARKPAAAARPETPELPPGPFRLGVIPGATPGKWIDIWHERMPHTALELVPLAVADQRDALVTDAVDAALVRLPLNADGLHVIRLYDELPVVVASVDSHLIAAEELHVADLAGEIVIVPADDVLALTVPDAETPRFAAPATTEDAVATVAAGVGVVIVPMSLARLHHRKDVDYRVLRGAAESTVALAWAEDRTTPLVDAFVGIVRGRTGNSSR